jgi:hypothetical protein
LYNVQRYECQQPTMEQATRVAAELGVHVNDITQVGPINIY